MEPFLQMFLNDQKKRDGRYHRTDTVSRQVLRKKPLLALKELGAGSAALSHKQSFY